MLLFGPQLAATVLHMKSMGRKNFWSFQSCVYENFIAAHS